MFDEALVVQPCIPEHESKSKEVGHKVGLGVACPVDKEGAEEEWVCGGGE